jgi:hypothetical protein
VDFRGEGFPNGTRYRAHITTMDISPTNGAETNKRQIRADIETVENGLLKTAVVNMGKFTKIEFEDVN